MPKKKTNNIPIPKRRKPGTKRQNTSSPFAKGGKGGPGRGHSKQNAALEAVVRRVEDEYKGKPPPGPREVLRMFFSDPGIAGQVVMATMLQKPSTMPQLLQAVESLDEGGYTPENIRETTQIITRFPIEGAPESDFQHAALVERAESAEKRVQSLELECERLNKLLDRMAERSGSVVDIGGDAEFSGPDVNGELEAGEDKDGLVDESQEPTHPSDDDDSPDAFGNVGFLPV